ncbi:MAG: NUDIX domain-containing protein [Nitrososphaeraceae archaeon]
MKISLSHDVVTVFLINANKILLLKRSNNVKTMRNKWAGISGFIENEDSLTCAYREIYEETGIEKNSIKLIRKGKIISLHPYENSIKLNIHPYLFLSMTKIIKLNWENSEYRWINPDEIICFDSVPKLDKVLCSVLPDRDK